MKIGSYVKFSEVYMNEWIENESKYLYYTESYEENERSMVLKFLGYNDDGTLILRYVIPTKSGRVKGLGAWHVELHEEHVVKTTLKESMPNRVEKLKQDEYYNW